MSGTLKFWIYCAFGLTGLYIAFIFLVIKFKNKLIFPAPAPSYNEAEMFLDLPNGEKCAAIWLESEHPDACVILYSHGNGEDLGEIEPILKNFQNLGFSVLSYDYIGYGQSKGCPEEKKIYMAADAAWEWLVKRKKIAPKKIVIFGYSLGSAAASHLAAEHQNARCLVLSGAFSDGINTVCPVKIVPLNILNNTEKLARTKLPVLLLHGTRDFVVPPRNARKNFHTLKDNKKKIVCFKGVGHVVVNAENYFDEISTFIKNL